MTVIKANSARIDTGGQDSTLGPYRAELISDSAGLTQLGAFIGNCPPARAALTTTGTSKRTKWC